MPLRLYLAVVVQTRPMLDDCWTATGTVVSHLCYTRHTPITANHGHRSHDGHKTLILGRVQQVRASIQIYDFLRKQQKMLTSSSASPSRQLTPTLSSSSQHSQTQSGPNPLSIRLYKVLAANFDDEATKDALNTLSELYSTPNTEHVALNGKQKGKETRIEESDEDGEEEDDDEEGKVGTKKVGRRASSIVEILPGEIAARARKNLKRDVEAKLAESSRKFLDAFAAVDKVGTYSRPCLLSIVLML